MTLEVFPADLPAGQIREIGSRATKETKELHAKADEMITESRKLLKRCDEMITGTREILKRCDEMITETRDFVKQVDKKLSERAGQPPTERAASFRRLGIGAPVRRPPIRCHRRRAGVDASKYPSSARGSRGPAMSALPSATGPSRRP